MTNDNIKYDATYKIGNTTINVVAPKNQTEEEKQKVLKEYHTAGWAIIKNLNETGKINDLL